MSTPALDISNNNGTITWHSVAGAGYGIAVMKRSEGTNYADPFFPANWAAAPSVGMARGSYHFSRPSANPGAAGGVAEANFYDSLLPVSVVGDVAAIDYEDENVADGVDLAPHLLALLQRFEALRGYKPMIYGGLWYLTNHNIIGNPAFADYGLWYSNPGGTLANTPVPAPWTFIAMLQTSWNGSVPGINGKVDLDEFAGTVQQFQAYGFQQPVTPPAPVVVAPTNDDFEQLHRLVDAQPFDAAPLISYASKFVSTSAPLAVPSIRRRRLVEGD